MHCFQHADASLDVYLKGQNKEGLAEVILGLSEPYSV